MKRLTKTSFLTALLVVGLAQGLLAITPTGTSTATGTGKSTSTSQGTGTKTSTTTGGSPNSPISAANTMGIRSAPTEKTMAKPVSSQSAAKPSADQQADFVYINDQDTDSLQRAIEAYNRRYPNQPIQVSNYSGELSGEILDRLIKYDFIKQAPPNVGNMRIVDGRIMRRVPRSQAEQKPSEKGNSADSMGGMLDAASRKLDQQSPRNVGNEMSPSDIQLEERKVTFRRRNGEYVERTYQVPRIPKPGRVNNPTGRTVAKPNDMLRRAVLAPKFQPMTKMQSVVTEGVPSIPAPPTASSTR